MIDILCKGMVQQLAVNRIVETGTDKGETVAETSQWFASGDYKIYSVDTDKYSYQQAKDKFRADSHIHLVHSSSELFLKSLLEQEAQEHNQYLFFLDAHWGKYWPLRDEIKVIQQLDRYIIVIDDVFVPGKSDPALPHGAFGFDIYENRILCWGYINDLFERKAVRVFYPHAPNRDQRGWMVLFCGYDEAQLQFMKSLALFEMQPDDKRHTVAVKPVWRSYWDLKNILKELIPIDLLRRLHRAYEHLMG